MAHDNTEFLQDQVKAAAASQQTLDIQGGNSKAFYGRKPQGKPLSTLTHTGVTYYEPSELVITARAGTPLSDITDLLAENGQVLAFDPPAFSELSTLGGVIAAGLSGPGRPWAGAARDMVLGVKIIDGQGQLLNFGGQVMKNVAGYDVSRLMVGAMGSLGLLSEISIKVLPAKEHHLSLTQEIDYNNAIDTLKQLGNQDTPVSAASYYDGILSLRLSGSQSATQSWADKIGGEKQENSDYWQLLRDHKLAFFQTDKPLWRLSLAPTTVQLECQQYCLIDWAGAQRWCLSDIAAEQVFAEAKKYAGHATLFKNGNREQSIFQPQDAINKGLHERLKNTFDPKQILNPGRLYKDQ